jgi:hypothetical protein
MLTKGLPVNPGELAVSPQSGLRCRPTPRHPVSGGRGLPPREANDPHAESPAAKGNRRRRHGQTSSLTSPLTQCSNRDLRQDHKIESAYLAQTCSILVQVSNYTYKSGQDYRVLLFICKSNRYLLYSQHKDTAGIPGRQSWTISIYGLWVVVS